MMHSNPIPITTRRSTSMPGPLSTLKVLDFSTLLPGPYATMMLADMGAEVLRVEAPDRVDLAKAMPPFDGKFSTTFSYLSRGKQTLQLNLRSEERRVGKECGSRCA